MSMPGKHIVEEMATEGKSKGSGSATQDESVHPQQAEKKTVPAGKPWQDRGSRNQSTRVSSVDRWMAKKFLELLNHPPMRIRLWNGETFHAEHAQIHTTMVINDRNALFSILLNPELNFGDLYSCGRIEIEGDLAALLEDAYQGVEKMIESPLLGVLHQLGFRRLNNNLDACREHIHHHYDISNDFYRLWLDREAMQYTCAYFPDPQMTIEQAQVAKLHHVCRKLQLQPGETVVEAGCGWGGLARFMAKHYGVKVRAYNISHQQILYARDKAREEGLQDQVEYIEDDYRTINGQYDAFVSVGMLEHVGRDFYATLGEVVRRALKPDGRGLIHSIGRNRPRPMNAWIERRIFPGAYPPSLKEMMDIFEPNDLSVQDVENLRLHYAKTLEHWLARFEQNVAAITEMMDEEFVRAWRLYLVGSMAAFTSGQLQLFQIVFNCAGSNRLPWSRAHLYNTSGD